MAYHEQGSYIIRARAVAHNEYNIVLKAFKYYYTKLCHKAGKLCIIQITKPDKCMIWALFYSIISICDDYVNHDHFIEIVHFIVTIFDNFDDGCK